MSSILKEPRRWRVPFGKILPHLTVGPVVMPTLSVAVRVTGTVSPSSTSIVPGLKDKTGDSVSVAVMETLSVAVPAFPAASLAVAVHVAMASSLTTGAV